MEQYILVALRTLKDFITSQKALEEIGNELIRIFQLVADVEEETSAALSLLSSLLERFPSAWRECIKPIIYNQTKRAYLCLGVISKIDKQGAIKSKADLDFIVEVAADHGMRAYDLLNYFLLKGIENGAISKPISNEKDYIQNFLSQISYPILEIYQAYKTKPAKAEKLKQRCLDMHLKIIGGDTQAEEKDEFFSAMLMYVFPPAVTTQREEYLRIYQQRSDRPQDIIVLSSNLQNPKPFKVSMGQYILKDYSKPLDETPWKTIKEVVQEVNPEVNPAVSEEEVAALGGELLEHWQKGGSLYQNRKELLNKLYRYFRYSRNATLPDSLDTVQNIMNINQFIGDTLNDLVNECIAQYKDRYPEMYRTVFEKMFPTRVANPQGAAERISEILTKFRDQNEAKTRVAGVLKNMEDHEAFEDIWQKIKDKTSKKEIANILEQVIFKIQPTKTSVVIVQRLQGSEYKAMQSEVSAKYEFSESSESVSLRFIVSKRRAHGVVGLNMGVCTAADEKLWNNPDFMNVIIFDENNIAQGGMHILIIEDMGKKYLTLPGINPSIELLSKVAADDIYSKLISYAQELAKALNCEAVLIPKNKVIHSNRSAIQRIISSKLYPDKINDIEPLTKIHPFSYSPEYSFQSVFVVDNSHSLLPSSLGVSSPISEKVGSADLIVQEDNNLGGIAFNALPIQTESVVGSFSVSGAFKGDLDAEWAQIQAVFNAGIRPSIQRLSEYTLAAAASPLAQEKIDGVRGLLADILRREEEDEKLSSASPAIKELVTQLESNSPPV